MLTIDTNILARYFLQDDSVQARAAEALLTEKCTEDSPAFVPTIVLVETLWVLRKVFTKPQLLQILDLLVHTKEFLLEQADVVRKAIETFQQEAMGFADCLIAAVAARHNALPVFTFDKKAARSDIFQLLSV